MTKAILQTILMIIDTDKTDALADSFVLFIKTAVTVCLLWTPRTRERRRRLWNETSIWNGGGGL